MCRLKRNYYILNINIKNLIQLIEIQIEVKINLRTFQRIDRRNYCGVQIRNFFLILGIVLILAGII